MTKLKQELERLKDVGKQAADAVKLDAGAFDAANRWLSLIEALEVAVKVLEEIESYVGDSAQVLAEEELAKIEQIICGTDTTTNND